MKVSSAVFTLDGILMIRREISEWEDDVFYAFIYDNNIRLIESEVGIDV